MDLGNVKDLEITHLSASCLHKKCEQRMNQSLTKVEIALNQQR